MPLHQYALPEEGYVRINQILGDKKANPPVPPVVPVGKTAWWAGVKDGRYPKPVKLGPRTTVWPVRAIRELLKQIEEKQSVQRQTPSVSK